MAVILTKNILGKAIKTVASAVTPTVDKQSENAQKAGLSTKFNEDIKALLAADAVTGGQVGDDTAGEIVTNGNVDDRLRISAMVGQEATVYGPNDRNTNVLSPLYATRGFMFPYTPSIQINQEVQWQTHDITHTNFDVLFYQRTPSANISLSGKFTVQNQAEGEYAIACIHFLRTVSKMYFGAADDDSVNQQTGERTNGLAGLAPPVLSLKGYGNFLFAALPCVIKGFSMNFDENMDTVRVDLPIGKHVYLPPLFSLTVNIGLQSNPSKVRQQFKLDDFRTGVLVGGWF